jgi:manganese efflux pump family protein
MEKTSFLDKIKNRWGITSNLQVLIIFLVFGVTGSMSLKVARPIMDHLGVNPADMNPWAYWPIRILISFISYQIMLIIFGTLAGQFRFFWNIEKKMLGRFIGKKY